MTSPFLIGLTGSVGMGKSTTAAMFAAQGVVVWDADAAVHRLYAEGGAAVPLIARLCPDAVVGGAVSRVALKRWMASDSSALKQIESVVHPLVAADRIAFINHAVADILLLDIPLLFEAGIDKMMDVTVVVSAPYRVQRDRVLARPGMNETQLNSILARQLPDSEKRARADYIIEAVTLGAAQKAVKDILMKIREKRQNA